MVRKALIASTLLAGAAWAGPPEGTIPAWHRWGANGDEGWIVVEEMDRSANLAGGFTTWVHWDHSKNKSVKYRSTVEKIRFDCKGSYSLLAYTSYMADGSTLHSWDGYGKSTAIRPGTLFQVIEATFCAGGD